MMKRIGLPASIEGTKREMLRIDAEELDVAAEDSGGM